MAESAAAASVAATNWRRRLVLADDDIDASLFWQIEDVADERPLVAKREPRVCWRDLRLAHQEEVDVVRRQSLVERRLDHVAGSGRLDDARRHDDGEIGLVLLIGGAAEQRA